MIFMFMCVSDEIIQIHGTIVLEYYSFTTNTELFFSEQWIFVLCLSMSLFHTSFEIKRQFFFVLLILKLWATDSTEKLSSQSYCSFCGYFSISLLHRLSSTHENKLYTSYTYLDYDIYIYIWLLFLLRPCNKCTSLNESF